MHKCNSVQFVSRQRGALFVASREFCGGLTACFFLVFRLTVKIFRGFTATSAKIWLGIWQLRLGAWAHGMGGDLSVHLCMHVCVQAFQWRHSPTSLPSISLVIFIHTHTCLAALCPESSFWYRPTRVVPDQRPLNGRCCCCCCCPGLPGWAGTRKVKPIWILLKQETVSGSGSGISWAICKSAPRSRQITTPAPHDSVFYRPDALPAAQPTASKHWR